MNQSSEYLIKSNTDIVKKLYHPINPVRKKILKYVYLGFNILDSIVKGNEESLDEIRDILTHQENYIDYLEHEILDNLDCFTP